MRNVPASKKLTMLHTLQNSEFFLYQKDRAWCAEGEEARFGLFGRLKRENTVDKYMYLC